MKVVFTLTCLSLAMYMTATQIERFYQNEDGSSVTYKVFNETPRDKYPTFSLCFKGAELYWYARLKVWNAYGISVSQYDLIMKGKTGARYRYNYDTMLYSKEVLDITNVTNTGFDEKWYLNISELLVDVEYTTENPTNDFHFAEGKGSKESLFEVGYQTADTICFTRKSNEVPGTIRLNDLVSLRKSVLGHRIFASTFLSIFVHYPGQLMRNFGFPAFQNQFDQIKSWEMVFEVTISEVSVLWKRPSANSPCDDENENDDLKMITKMIEKLECIPNYWKGIVQKNLGFKDCNTSAEFKKAHELVQDYNKMLSSYLPPCVQMTAPSITVRAVLSTDGNANIKFLYKSKYYMEIRNSKDFGFESFWSAVGGFIGIFMGYSLLQLPELLGGLPSFMRDIKGE